MFNRFMARVVGGHWDACKIQGLEARIFWKLLIFFVFFILFFFQEGHWLRATKMMIKRAH